MLVVKWFKSLLSASVMLSLMISPMLPSALLKGKIYSGNPIKDQSLQPLGDVDIEYLEDEQGAITFFQVDFAGTTVLTSTPGLVGLINAIMTGGLNQDFLNTHRGEYRYQVPNTVLGNQILSYREVQGSFGGKAYSPDCSNIQGRGSIQKVMAGRDKIFAFAFSHPVLTMSSLFMLSIGKNELVVVIGDIQKTLREMNRYFTAHSHVHFKNEPDQDEDGATACNTVNCFAFNETALLSSIGPVKISKTEAAISGIVLLYALSRGKRHFQFFYELIE